MKRSIYPGSWVVRHQLCCLRWHCLVSNWSYFVVLRPFTMLYIFTHRRYYANPFLYIIQTFLPNYFIFPLNKQMPQLLQTAFFFPCRVCTLYLHCLSKMISKNVLSLWNDSVPRQTLKSFWNQCWQKLSIFLSSGRWDNRDMSTQSVNRRTSWTR